MTIRYDSIADLTFYAIMLMKMYPVLIGHFAAAHWVMILSAIAVHLAAYIVCSAKFKKFSAVHTYLNKAMGVMVFLLP